MHLDAKQIRVLAHPLRARLLGQLRIDGPATATRLAEALGTNTGATSYHLRQLAAVGLVAEEDGAGRGRERWWRSAHRVSSWQPGDYAGDPDATAAAEWMESHWLRIFNEQAEAWHRVRGDAEPQWRDAAGFSDFQLELSAGQLGAMNDEIAQVVERYRQVGPGPEARRVLLYVYGFPYQGEGK